jgi:hypothetical protein
LGFAGFRLLHLTVVLQDHTIAENAPVLPSGLVSDACVGNREDHSPESVLQGVHQTERQAAPGLAPARWNSQSEKTRLGPRGVQTTTVDLRSNLIHRNLVICRLRQNPVLVGKEAWPKGGESWPVPASIRLLWLEVLLGGKKIGVGKNGQQHPNKELAAGVAPSQALTFQSRQNIGDLSQGWVPISVGRIHLLYCLYGGMDVKTRWLPPKEK